MHSLKEVMTRHSLAPVHNIDYLHMMYKKFSTTNNLLLLRARDADGPLYRYANIPCIE